MSDKIRTAPIRICDLCIGHMIRHEGENKIVDGMSPGYPRLDSGWSVTVTFTDSTSIVLPYPTADTTVDIITSFY